MNQGCHLHCLGFSPASMSINPGFFQRKQKENKTNRTSCCVAIQFLTNIDRLEGLPGINTKVSFFFFFRSLSYDIRSFTFLQMAVGQGLWKLPSLLCLFVCFFFKKQFWFVRITFIPAWIKTSVNLFTTNLIF